MVVIDPADHASKPDGSPYVRINSNDQATKVEPALAPKSQDVNRRTARECIDCIVNSEETGCQESV